VTTINPQLGRLLAGAGGALLLASLFMPWADVHGGGSRDGWDFSATSDVFLAVVAVFGIAAAITGGRFGFFRPDVSMNGATDILGVVAAFVLGWLLVFDFPSDASPAVGVYLALVGAIVIASGAGDFRVKSVFPRLPEGDQRQ
jgi:hypothetical protein